METHWKKLTNPNYLGSWDFEKGEERELMIKIVKQEEVFNPSAGKKERCTVAHFAESSKPMILNKVNCKMITKLYNTPFIERWTGCKIIVIVQKVKAKGELVDALRIKDEKPQSTPPKILSCTDCGSEIKAFEKYSAEQIASTAKNRYGVELCINCRQIRGKKEMESENCETNA